MTFCGEVGNGPGRNRLNFVDDPDFSTSKLPAIQFTSFAFIHLSACYFNVFCDVSYGIFKLLPTQLASSGCPATENSRETVTHPHAMLAKAKYFL